MPRQTAVQFTHLTKALHQNKIATALPPNHHKVSIPAFWMVGIVSCLSLLRRFRIIHSRDKIPIPLLSPQNYHPSIFKHDDHSPDDGARQTRVWGCGVIWPQEEHQIDISD